MYIERSIRSQRNIGRYAQAWTTLLSSSWFIAIGRVKSCQEMSIQPYNQLTPSTAQSRDNCCYWRAGRNLYAGYNTMVCVVERGEKWITGVSVDTVTSFSGRSCLGMSGLGSWIMVKLQRSKRGCALVARSHQRTAVVVNQARRLGLFFSTGMPSLSPCLTTHQLRCSWCDDRKCVRNTTLHEKRRNEAKPKNHTHKKL